MPVSVYIATSLDGFIARQDGRLDWLNDIPNPEQSDFGYAEFMRDVDAVVMGRRTFETVLGFAEWPFDKPVVVLCADPRVVPERLRHAAEPMSGPPAAIIAALAARGLRRLYVDGGETVRRFLREDLVDRLILTRVPVLLGRGVPLFDGSVPELRFRQEETSVYEGALVKTVYSRARA